MPVNKLQSASPAAAHKKTGGLSVDDIKQGLSHISESGFEDSVMANTVPAKIQAAFQKLEPGQDDVSEFYKVSVKGHALFVSNTDTANGQVLHVFDGATGKPLLSGSYHTDGEPVTWATSSGNGAGTASFTGSGPGTSVTLGGVKATQLPLGDQIASALKSLDTADGHLFAGAYTFPPAQLKGALGDPKALKTFAFDTMAATGAKEFMGDPGTFSEPDQQMVVTPVSAGNARGTLNAIASHYITADERPKSFDAGVKTIADAMLKDPSTQFYKAAWNNTDDTDNQALIAVNAQTGQVRVFLGNNQP